MIRLAAASGSYTEEEVLEEAVVWYCAIHADEIEEGLVGARQVLLDDPALSRLSPEEERRARDEFRRPHRDR